MKPETKSAGDNDEKGVFTHPFLNKPALYTEIFFFGRL